MKMSVEEALRAGVNDVSAIVSGKEPLITFTHPEYTSLVDDWEKWRLTFDGGDAFIDEYLKKFSTRESDTDFNTRKEVSYNPAFAKSAVTDVRDAIFQRIADVTRKGGAASYLDAIEGKGGGVDRAGTTMNSFIGREVLEELLVMSKVGVFIDMPPLNGPTLVQQQGINPYVYIYKAEDIINWEVDERNSTLFTKLLLREIVYEKSEASGLPSGTTVRYKYMWVLGENVLVQLFNSDSEPITRSGDTGVDIAVLELPVIPFAIFQISDSLLKDVANYQIALLNLASSDIAYSLQSNFPFYVEQYDPRVDNLYRRSAGNNIVHTSDDSTIIVQGGESEDSVAAKPYEVQVGATTGRRVPRGLELPRYIHPSSDPLKASMEKQAELKKDIRMLVKLAVSNLQPKMASAESKGYDERGLEAGLSAIGLELEHGERLIGLFWQTYIDKNGSPPTVIYPQKYSLQSDSEKRKEAKDTLDISKDIPSPLFKRESMKTAAAIVLGSKVSSEMLEEINKEIDSVQVVTDSDTLERDIELGLIDIETASASKGYPKGSVERAKKDHAERVKRIAESQAKARGVSDLGGIADTSRDEKLNKDDDEVAKEKTRGEAK